MDGVWRGSGSGGGGSRTGGKKRWLMGGQSTAAGGATGCWLNENEWMREKPRVEGGKKEEEEEKEEEKVRRLGEGKREMEAQEPGPGRTWTDGRPLAGPGGWTGRSRRNSFRPFGQGRVEEMEGEKEKWADSFLCVCAFIIFILF
jgi:hypothetical protein